MDMPFSGGPIALWERVRGGRGECSSISPSTLSPEVMGRRQEARLLFHALLSTNAVTHVLLQF